MIAFSNVCRIRRDDKQSAVVLHDLNLMVPPRARVGIFGHSGSGRSTLARLASKVEHPDKGRVTHVGRVSWPIGFSGYLHKEMTGTDNVRVVAGLMGGDPERLLAYVMAFSGLESVMSHRVSTYASYERDRLALALAFAFPADTYVVDGFPALGNNTFQMQCLQEMKRRLVHSGMLLLSRNKRHLESMCDTFFALRDGTLHRAVSAEHAEALALPVHTGVPS